MAQKDAPGVSLNNAVLFEVFSSMLNSISEPAFLMTPEGIVLAANRTVAVRFGFQSGNDPSASREA
ncbi:MAG: hypothetical protein Q7I97_08370 [Thermovirgaceae bacterium]|nr:hypothetical protein [Thermovirgaceae bacterium]